MVAEADCAGYRSATTWRFLHSNNDYNYYNDVDFINPKSLEQVDVTFPLDIEEYLSICLPVIEHSSQTDWIGEDLNVTSVLLLLYHLASLEQDSRYITLVFFRVQLILTHESPYISWDGVNTG